MAPITGEYYALAQRRRWRSCERKAGYPNEKVAASRAQRMSMRDGELFLAYQCYYCGKWHVGHEKWERKMWDAVLHPESESI